MCILHSSPNIVMAITIVRCVQHVACMAQMRIIYGHERNRPGIPNRPATALQCPEKFRNRTVISTVKSNT
jgi:hypothetical protein